MRTVAIVVVEVVVVVIKSKSGTLVDVSIDRCCSFNSITAFARPPFDSA